MTFKRVGNGMGAMADELTDWGESISGRVKGISQRR